MSHPDNTFKEIIERRDNQIKLLMGIIDTHEKKFKSLIKIFELYISTTFAHQGQLDLIQSKRFLDMLDEVRKL